MICPAKNLPQSLLAPRVIMGARCRRERADKNRLRTRGERDDAVAGHARCVPWLFRRVPHEPESFFRLCFLTNLLAERKGQLLCNTAEQWSKPVP